MIESPRKLTGFKYAATLVGALAVFALAPATAHALPVNNNEGGGVTTRTKTVTTSQSTRARMFSSTARSSAAAVDRSSLPLRRRALAGPQSRPIRR